MGCGDNGRVQADGAAMERPGVGAWCSSGECPKNTGRIVVGMYPTK